MQASNRLFTLGLLLDIGHAVMTAKAPELVADLRNRGDQGRPDVRAELGLFGFDYCQLGAALLRHWHLPEFLPQVLECQLCPEQAVPDNRAGTDIAFLARGLCGLPEEFDQQRARLLDGHHHLMVGRLVAKAISAHADELFGLYSLAL